MALPKTMVVGLSSIIDGIGLPAEPLRPDKTIFADIKEELSIEEYLMRSMDPAQLLYVDASMSSCPEANTVPALTSSMGEIPASSKVMETRPCQDKRFQWRVTLQIEQ
jgi:hypothetical protein